MTGALAEGEIAAEAILNYLQTHKEVPEEDAMKAKEKQQEYENYLTQKQSLLTIEQAEESMQKIMDEYAGGISTDYQYNESRLKLADEKICNFSARGANAKKAWRGRAFSLVKKGGSDYN